VTQKRNDEFEYPRWVVALITGIAMAIVGAGLEAKAEAQETVEAQQQRDGRVRVVTAPLHVTDIILAPEERVVALTHDGKPLSGRHTGSSLFLPSRKSSCDPAQAGCALFDAWIINPETLLVNGKEQQHVYLKPTRAGMREELRIRTDRRTYLVDLVSLANGFTVAVSWPLLAPARPPLRQLCAAARTRIDIQPDERVVAPVAAGDIVRWRLEYGDKSGQYVTVTPVAVGLHTNLIINATRRTYYFELHSSGPLCGTGSD
jgi:type IV secretory pathway VirB9-like protein